MGMKIWLPISICIAASSQWNFAQASETGKHLYECQILSEQMLEEDGFLEENQWVEQYRLNSADRFTFDEVSGVMRWHGVPNEIRRWEVLQVSSNSNSTIAMRQGSSANYESLHVQGWMKSDKVPFIWSDQILIKTGLCGKN